MLVLGILSIVVCGILGPFAWKMGNTELAAIDAGRRSPQDRKTTEIGRIIGIVGTALLGVGVAVLFVYVIFILIFAVGAVASGG